MRILYFASGPPIPAARMRDQLRERFPSAEIDYVVCPAYAQVLRCGKSDRIVFRAGERRGRLRFLWKIWREPYSARAVLLGGDAGYATMKLAAVLYPRPSALVVGNSHGELVPFSATRQRLSDFGLFAFHRTVGEIVGLGLVGIRVGLLVLARRRR